MLAIMGATGNTGGAVAAELLRRGAPVRALTRDLARAAHLRAAGAEVAAADPADADALAAAFAGAEGAYVMIPPHLNADDVLAEGRRAATAIAAAVRRAGMRHVVALSSGGAHLAEGTGVVRTLYDFEAALGAALGGTGATLTLLRAADFMENWAFAVPTAAEHGVLPSGRAPLDGPMQTVSAVDVGRAAAASLLEGPPNGTAGGTHVLNLLGPTEYAPRDVARAFADALGRPVEAVPVPPEALAPGFVEAGIGADYAQGLAAVYAALNAGHIAFEPGVGETRRGAVTFGEAARRMAAGAGVA